MTVSEDDYQFLVAETKRYIAKIPYLLRPMAPTLRQILEKIPECLHKYTVTEVLEAIDRAERSGDLPAKLK